MGVKKFLQWKKRKENFFYTQGFSSIIKTTIKSKVDTKKLKKKIDTKLINTTNSGKKSFELDNCGVDENSSLRFIFFFGFQMGKMGNEKSLKFFTFMLFFEFLFILDFINEYISLLFFFV